MKSLFIKTLFFLSFIFCLFPSKTDAQHTADIASMNWGKPYRVSKNTSLSKIVAVTPWGFYALRKRKGSLLTKDRIFLELYDSKMNLKRAAELNLNQKGESRSYENIVMLGENLFLLTTYYDSQEDKNKLFYQKIDNNTLAISGELRQIGEIPSTKKGNPGSFDLKVSSDSSRVLIYNQLPYKKGDPERFTLRVFDNEFNELWSKEIALPYGDASFSVEKYRIDKQGNVYLMGARYTSSKKVGKRTAFHYVILSYSQQGEEVQEYHIDLEDKFITDLTFKVGDDGDLVCSGFYSERGTYSIKGTYFFRLDTDTKEVYSINLKPFDFDFLTQYMSEGTREKARRAERAGDTERQAELFQFLLRDIVLRSDGGALLIAEQYFIFRRYYRSYGGSSSRDYYYNYNDLVIVNIQPTGEIEWAVRIPKRQSTLNDLGLYSSYSMAIVQDRIYLLYNENPKNFDFTSRRSRPHNFNGLGSVVSAAEVKKDGTMSTYPLFSNRDVKIITRPKVCRQTGKKEILIYGEWGREYRFGKLQFN